MRGKIQKLHKGAHRLDKSRLLKAALLITALAGPGILFNQYLHRYDINPDQAKLLSRVSVNTDNITQGNSKISYRSPQVVKNQVNSIVTASTADSTGSLLYNADFDNNGGLIKFSDSKGDLSFSLKPLQDIGSAKLNSGRIIYASSNGPKSVYTLKRNGIKGDILLNKSPGNTFTKSWQLSLGSNLIAKVLANGSVGIYSANPYLFGNLTVADDKSQKLVDNARKNGAKDNLVFVIPAPYLVEANGTNDYKDVSYHLNQDTLTLAVTNLDQQEYPLSIDPSVVVTTTADFRTGSDDGNLDYSITGEIDRGNISLGTIGTFSTNINYFATPRRAPRLIAYNGYMYMLGGWQYGDAADTNCKNTGSGITCNDVQYAAINSGGDLGTWSNTTYMPMGRNGGGVQAYNGYLYIVGGSEGPSDTNCKNTGIASTFCNDTIYALVCTGSNSGIGGCGSTPGTIGTWNTNSTYFSIPRTSLSSAIYNGFMYVLGGTESASNASCKNSGSSNACNDTQYAKINADGSLGSWTINTTYFTTPRSEHGTVAYNNFLYVVGGQDPSLVDYSDIQYAAINADGSVGSWTTNAVNLLENHENFGVTVSNGYMYYVGGFNNIITTGCPGGNCKAVDYAPIYANGSTGTWVESTNYLPSNRQDFGTTIYNGRIYVGGGTTGSGTSSTCKSPTFTSSNCDDVVYVSVNTGTTSGYGNTAAFANTSNYKVPVYGQASAVYNGYLYITGGNAYTTSTACASPTGGNYCNDTQYAPINSDGTIGAFTRSTNYFSVDRYNHAAVATAGYLYILGGTEPSSDTSCKNTGIAATFCNDVQYAAINPADGSIGAWNTTSYFSNPRYSFRAGAYNGKLYLSGGNSTNATTDCPSSFCSDIQYATVNSNGTLGAWQVNTNHFSIGRDDHGMAIFNGYLYIVGGNENASDTNCKNAGATASTMCNDTQYALISTVDGSVGTFTTSTNFFTTPRDFPNVTAYNNYLYVIGGTKVATSSTACEQSIAAFSCQDVQKSAIASNGSIGAWSIANYFTTPRQGPSVDSYNGYIYVEGGRQDSINSNCNNNSLSTDRCDDVQVAGQLGPSFTSNYEKTVDVGSLSTISSVLINGTTCRALLYYKLGPANGVYGSVTTAYITPGTSIPINLTARYVWFRLTVDDSSCGLTSKVTDITVNYSLLNSTPAQPTLLTPISNAQNIAVQPIFTLRTTDPDNDYLRYRIKLYQSDCSTLIHTVDQTASQVGWTGQDQQTNTAYTGNSILTSSTIATHTYQFADLNQVNTYCWNAAAIDPGGSNTWSSDSATQLFTTAQTSGVIIKSGTTINSGVTIH